MPKYVKKTAFSVKVAKKSPASQQAPSVNIVAASPQAISKTNKEKPTTVSPAKLSSLLKKIGKIVENYTSGNGTGSAEDFSQMSKDITVQLAGKTYAWLAAHACSIDYELEGMTRDLFGGAQFDEVGLIKKYRLFNTTSFDYSQEEAGEGLAVLGDLHGKLPWALVFSAYISPYCDEDYDIRGTVTMIFGQPTYIKQLVAKKVGELSTENLKFFLENSAGLINDAEEFIPHDTNKIYERMVKELYRSDFGKRLFASLQHEDLQTKLPPAPVSGAKSRTPKL